MSLRNLVLTLLSGTLIAAGPALAEQAQHTMTKSVDVTMDYLLDLPAGYDEAAEGETFPLVVYLHGGGAADLDSLAEQFLPTQVAGMADLPFIMVSPRNPREDEFFPQEYVDAVVDEIVATEKVDADRVYLVGYSRGAFTALQMIQNYPGDDAAVVSVAGGGMPHYLDRVRGWTPFWFFHGNNDDTVKLMESVAMVQKLKDLGGDRDLRFTVYEGVGHGDVDDRAFADPALWEWLLQQTRVEPDTVRPTAKSTDTVIEPATVK
jgi:predicted peptidase